MQEFLDYIRKGEFRIHVCASCKKKIWPPSRYCPECLSYLKNIEGMFGIVDLSGIRLVGSIFGRPLRHGMEVTMIKCGINSDGSIFYHFKAH
jgi:hypothetical protein